MANLPESTFISRDEATKKLSELLKEVLSIRNVTWTTYRTGRPQLDVDGLIKIKGHPEDEAEWRVAAITSYNTLLSLLDAVNVKHTEHPELRLTGELYEYLGGTARRIHPRGEVSLYLTP